jgi:ribosomal protein S19
MGRSKWKIPFLDLCFNNKNFLANKNIKIWSRKSVIPASLIGKQVSVYNGQNFKKIPVRIVGHDNHLRRTDNR